jgi:2-polyprenyl-6-methoxyphenol hydroxylase-like FAD-dependent oxidoreductase
MPGTVVQEVPVLVIGGSMVGLSTAVFLAHHGVAPLVVERHDGTAIHPRAGHFHLRTLELLRSVGLEDAVREMSAAHFFPNGGVNAVQTLAGGEVESYISDLNHGVADLSPSRRLFVAQQALEPVLREAAERAGAVLRYGTEGRLLSQDADGVLAVVRDRATGVERTVRARYVVAADGWRSPIRDHLGIGMQGHGRLSDSATIYFRADCRELLADTDLGVIYVNNPAVRGFFRFERTGTSGFLAVNTLGDPTRPGALDVTAGLTTEGAADVLRAAIGVPDLAVEVLDVAPWQARADVAERYQDGRVFLVGDAAHVVPPNGGFGGNTGIQDAHNLAWKLALAVQGSAGDGLLATYDAERRPVGRLTIDQAHTRYRRRTTPELMEPDVADLVDDLSMEIGYRYRSTAVVAEDDSSAGGVVGDPRTAGGRPGTRAPHVPLLRDGTSISSLDLYGSSFVVLVGPEGKAWYVDAEEAAVRLGLTVAVHVVGPAAEIADSQGAFLAAHGITAAGAVVVRPDGFVAWRSPGAPGGDELTLSRVLGALLRPEGA